MEFLKMILYFVGLLAITFGILVLGRKYVFSKVKVNKYILLGISIVLFVLQIFLPAILGKNVLWLSMLLTIITVIFFLWFMDVVSTGGPKRKEKQIQIRPKAKPNRVKHLKNQNNNK